MSNRPDHEADLLNDATHPRLPAELTSELSRLFSAGFSLIPLGGSDGKKPIVRFRDRKRLPLSLVVNTMANGASHTYGIRLGGILVVDVDTDTPEARAYVEQRFGLSPVSTRTGRGFHLYYRYSGPKPKQIRLPEIAIDFKSGGNEFAVGALSRRPDGVVYRQDGRLISIDHLPRFDDRDEEPSEEEPERIEGRITEGSRHTSLKRRARQLALIEDSFGDLLANLLSFRDWEIVRPEDFSDLQIEALARWFWNKREKGQLWGGRNSVVPVHRSTISKCAKDGEALAFMLYALLLAEHGHRPEELFAVVPDALRHSGRLKAGRHQIYRAIRFLLEAGLLHCRQKPRGRRNHYLYQLATPGQEENDEGRSSLILVPDKDTHRGPGDEGLAA